jgi:hypothetical protein
MTELRLINGGAPAIVRPDPLPVPLLTAPQARAHVALTRAIQDQYDQGVLTPCRMDPGTWDADDSSTPVQRDIKRAARLCRFACPVFAECRAFLATEPPVHGIVAGEFRRHPRDERRFKTTYGPDMRAAWAAETADDDGLDGAA